MKDSVSNPSRDLEFINQSGADPFESEAEHFFSVAVASFDEALSRSGAKEHTIQIADKLVQMVFAGGAMVSKVMPPFAHIELSDLNSGVGTDRLKVLIWDSESTGTQPLEPPWCKEDFTQFGQVIPCSLGRFRAVYESDGRLLSMTDLKTGTAIYWARDSREIPFHVLATPLRAILNVWLSQFGFEFVHAAAIGNDNCAVLVAGRGGAGKSSTAVTCLDAGLSYLSDDYCLISAKGTPNVYTVYSSAKVVSSDLTRYNVLNGASGSIFCKFTNKRLFYLAPIASEQMPKKLPIKAILFPHIGKDKTAVSTISTKKAFFGIVDTSSVLFPYSHTRGIGVFAELTRKVPAYSVELGPDRLDVVRVIREILEPTEITNVRSL